MREAAFQLLDALERLESAERKFQKRFRHPNTLQKMARERTVPAFGIGDL